jgi:transcriptional regulator with XRE-family HTH domain
MTDQIGPAVAKERLRARLADLRKQSRLTPEDVSRKTHWSISKLSRIETGSVTIQPTDVQALATLYNVDDPEEVAELMNLAVASRRRQWWNSYPLGNEYREFIAYEDDASRITVFQALIVPGLLQTADYAKAITAAVLRKAPTDPEIERLIEVRMKRQRGLFKRMRQEEPPELVALLDGAILRRPVGGAEVMRAQLTHLLDLAEEHQVKLVVVPLEHGGHPGLGGIFELLEFAGSGDPDIVFVESTVKDFVLKDKETTQGYHDIANAIAAAGLNGEDAVNEIRRIRDQL